jgi:hypothetical protein
MVRKYDNIKARHLLGKAFPKACGLYLLPGYKNCKSRRRSAAFAIRKEERKNEKEYL